jgi:hypothetical protein
MDEGTDAQSESISIGLDSGFGATKAACAGLRVAQVATVLSVVGAGSWVCYQCVVSVAEGVPASRTA